MLVVVGIVAGLAALTVLLFPRLQDSQRSTKAADLVQQQLFVAKQMALRDQQPRGVRFVSSAGVRTGPFDQLQLVEQPAAYSLGLVQNPITMPNQGWPQDLGPGTGNTGWFLIQVIPDPLAGTPDFSNNTVQAGDLLDLSAANDQYTIVGQPGQFGAMHLIMNVQPAPPGQPQLLWILTQPQIKYTGSPFNFYYRILRSPRPLTGEAVVNLPRTAAGNIGMAVDSPFTAYPNANPTQGSLIPQDTDSSYQVMFDPSGKVLRASGSQGKVVLWVKNFDPDNKWVADEILIAVYTRNGLITSQPVNLNGNLTTPPNRPDYPYFFVTDGATSGM
jgi:type II secretory pathway pseudopilin PulG